MKTKLSILCVLLAATSQSFAVDWTYELIRIHKGPGWADSYSHNGVCYIDSTFDHGVGDKKVNGYTVRELARLLPKGPGKAGNPLYNDVQCGNGPANNAGDEDLCPGRVDLPGLQGCTDKGPAWDWGSLPKDDDPDDGGTTDKADCITMAPGLRGAKVKFAYRCYDYTLSHCGLRPNGKYACYSDSSGAGDDDTQEIDCKTLAWRKPVAIQKFSTQCKGAELADCKKREKGDWVCYSIGSVVNGWTE